MQQLKIQNRLKLKLQIEQNLNMKINNGNSNMKANLIIMQREAKVKEFKYCEKECLQKTQ